MKMKTPTEKDIKQLLNELEYAYKHSKERFSYLFWIDGYYYKIDNELKKYYRSEDCENWEEIDKPKLLK